MNNKIALLILAAFFYLNGTAEGAEIDGELAIIAAEQQTGETTNPTQENLDDKKKIDATLKTETPVEETVIIIEEVAKPEEVEKPVEVVQTEEVAKPEEVEKPVEVAKPVEVTKPVEVAKPVEQIQPAENLNASTSYANFQDLAAALKFTPLYIPKKSGYTINSISSIGNRIAEVSYGRRWEPEVSLRVRTYKRGEGEGLKDISGIEGVKWRIDMTSGASVYIAKINERSHAAAWASGNYTFSAYVENLSFAAFHSLVIDELVDITTHYYAE